MPRYSCYSLSVDSEFDIPEFVLLGETGVESPVDVEIHIGSVDEPPPPANDAGMQVLVTPGRSHFYWKEVGHYLVLDGSTITIDPTDGVEAAMLRLPMLGIVFGALLAQRGYEVLHASAASVDGAVVGLLGDKGMGKSTTAAALHRAGHVAVTDDVLATREGENGCFEMLPAFPHLKLWPQAIDQLGGSVDQMQPLHSRVTKRAVMLDGAFPIEPLPLSRLYILDWGDETVVEPMGMSAAFAAVAPHTFGRRYPTASPDASAKTLRSVASLVRGVPVKRLMRKPDLQDVARIVEVVEADLQSEPAVAHAR